jgi:hypothetical protein
VVGSAAQDEGGGEGDEERPLGHEYEGKLGFVVYDDQGRGLLQSAAAPLGALDALLALRAADGTTAGAASTLLDAGGPARRLPHGADGGRRLAPLPVARRTRRPMDPGRRAR